MKYKYMHKQEPLKGSLGVGKNDREKSLHDDFSRKKSMHSLDLDKYDKLF